MYSDLVTFITGFLFVIIIAIFITAFPLWLLWNWIMPLFGLPNLTLFQCWGLMLLVHIFTIPNNYMREN